MATVQRSGTRASECRRCRTFCDELIEPRGCIELGCRFLYSYEDQLTGGRYMGCLRKVFRAEIDLDMFDLAEADGGYGGIKMSGEPLPSASSRSSPPTRVPAAPSPASTRASSTAPTRGPRESGRSTCARSSSRNSPLAARAAQLG